MPQLVVISVSSVFFFMGKETIIILVVVGLAIFVWLPAIIVSGRKAMKKDKKSKNTNK